MATYYVANNGNDANNGTAAVTPWKTIAKLNATTFVKGDVILFNRGDTWKEKLILKVAGVNINAYGSGRNPTITSTTVLATTAITSVEAIQRIRRTKRHF